MPALACPNCHSLLPFEATACATCSHPVAFDPDGGAFLHFRSAAGWLSLSGKRFAGLPCGNKRLGVCNWLAAGGGNSLCRSCRHNRTIPPLSVPGVLERWKRVEEAKRRLIYQLSRLGLPLDAGPSPGGLVFDLLYDPSAEGGFSPEVLTGHAGGVITLNLIEADDAARERIRAAMGEPYRTLLGHFRHEVAHYYWHRLVEASPDLPRFRSVFGDERTDYATALAAHYRRPPESWSDRYISAYAAAHPWEDFAETFAHYLHIVDVLATARDLHVTVERPSEGVTQISFDPHVADAATLIGCWIPFASSLNAINRSMGLPDLYPFSLTPTIAFKLDFVIRLVAFTAGRWTPGDAEAADLKAMAASLTAGLTG
ncbi:zinc-binding metallopeptidase family protein [Sphingomonas nostoxanthinifaciens]|uniref:zinc-binding metallopeptidase family protein n=1 Tax=Sphingomonas nostoxanthinifaciens TaxID=2872652 RepID=UPI001CC1D06B|nr:putative zinc-binding metallopeptidase [Sphingomonas nostoxanthinifaciens]UAK25676.1 putative zinc-binding peptidase [Sphingomonas nostoxanthinifaciens]